MFYLQEGSVKLSVLSRLSKEAVVAILGPGDFFGEGCLAGQPRRMATAMALSASTVLVVEKPQMLEMLHTRPSLADRFLSHMLARNIRIEEDLVDQLFNSSEKRLARALLLLARYGKEDQPLQLKLSQETLAEIVGTTRSRINFFMNKFRDLGFIEYKGHIKVHSSLLTGASPNRLSVVDCLASSSTSTSPLEMARIAQSSWRRRRATSSSLSFWPTVMWPSSPRNALPNRVPKNSSSAWRSSVEMDRLATWRVSAHPRLRPHRPHGQGEECPACETQRRSSPRVGERSRAPEGHASNRLILKQLVDRSGRSR